MTDRTNEGPGNRIPGPFSSPAIFAIALLQEVRPHQVREHMESPFPPWAGPLSRFLFSVPQWVMIGGIVLAAIVFLAIASFVWLEREPLMAGWRARSRAFRSGLLAGVGILAIVGAGLGWESWSFMQHGNDFCQSCHIMDVPFDKFTDSEHSDLQCHDCHRQPLTASMRQLYLWVVDRPEEIGEHAPVPNDICAECHIQEQPDSLWQRIVATAGHRVHLESDSLPELMCVKCHGIEIHRFVPVDQTCGQSECHDPDKTEIVLGSMAGQNDLHCVGCHQFTAPVAETSAIDTARAALVPRQEQCFSCHQMREQLVTFDPELEPHGAVCGTCHDPHTQETPELADESCASGACHARADTLTPFHRGLAEDVAADCVGCHRAHTFLVEGENCAACHADIPGAERTRVAVGLPARSAGTPRAAGGDPPAVAVPIHLVSGAPHPDRPLEGRDAVRRLYLQMRAGSGGASRQQAGGFEHRAHASIACTDCHSFETTHGAITARTERDCMECHHTAPVVNRGCEQCHASAATPPRSVRFTMRLGVWSEARIRSVAFDHEDHAAVGCATCHTEGLTRPVTRGCESCHGEHHAPTADCTVCHAQPSDDVHTIAVHTEGCAGSGCHEDRAITTMTRTNPFCLSCHQDMRDHRPGRVCAGCHRIPDIEAGGAP